MKIIFVATLFLVFVCCPVSIGLSQDKYELSNVKVKLVKTGSIGDITKYKNFDLGRSEMEGCKGFEELAIKLLEGKGFKNVEHNAAQISFVYTFFSKVIDDSTVPWMKEDCQKGDMVLYIVLVAHDKETVATGYKDADARSWGAEARATVMPPLPSPTLDNEKEEGKILIALYKKLLVQLIDKCIPEKKK